MKFNKYENLAAASAAFFKKGFNNNFELKKEGMVNLKTGKIYTTNDMKIVEYHRFEETTEKGFKGMFIVFAVECTDKRKGLVISSYETYSDMKLVKFMDKVRVKVRVAA